MEAVLTLMTDVAMTGVRAGLWCGALERYGVSAEPRGPSLRSRQLYATQVVRVGGSVSKEVPELRLQCEAEGVVVARKYWRLFEALLVTPMVFLRMRKEHESGLGRLLYKWLGAFHAWLCVFLPETRGYL
jgi:hypothetical protein